MCGIFAWAGKNPTKFNRSSFNILGLYNESRGKTSCGETIDGTIRIGLKATRLFKDYLVSGEPLANPVKMPTVIGHTRQASNGDASIENAHPFGFGLKNNIYKFIGVHNGTLYNKTEIANTYDVKISEEEKGLHYVTNRVKIDSEILLECIYHSTSFNVLEDYTGGAALVFTNTEEPNVIYCYRGESKHYEHSATTEGERPLFFFKESKNSLYISSLKSSLQVLAGGDDTNIGEFDTNIVYKITNGDISKAIKYKIDRSNQTQKQTYGSSFNNNSHFSSNNGKYGINKRQQFKKKAEKITKANSAFNTSEKIIELSPDQNIYKETPRFATIQVGKRPIFHKLRYFRNGHLINGIYTFISDYGFYFLGHTRDEAAKVADSVKGKIFNYEDGEFDTYAASIAENKKVAFFLGSEIKFSYFVQGVNLRTELDYLTVKARVGQTNEFTWKQLSHMSKHPVCNILTNMHYTAQNVMFNGDLYTGWWGGLGAYKTYKFINGNLVDTNNLRTPSNLVLKPKKPIIELPLPKAEVNPTNQLHDCVCGDNTCITCQVEDEWNNLGNSYLGPNRDNEEADNALVLDTIDEIFEDALTKLPVGKEALKKYLPNKNAEKAIKIINTLIDSTLEIN